MQEIPQSMFLHRMDDGEMDVDLGGLISSYGAY
jgi:hypothetical protein